MTNAKRIDSSWRSLCSGLSVRAVCQKTSFAPVPSAGQTPGTLSFPLHPALLHPTLLHPLSEEGGWCSISYLGSLCYFGYSLCFPCLFLSERRPAVRDPPLPSERSACQLQASGCSQQLTEDFQECFLSGFVEGREAELGGWHSRKQKCASFSRKAPNLLPLQPQSNSWANCQLTEVLKCHQELEQANATCLFEVVKMK